jgi:hypothetical protein
MMGVGVGVKETHSYDKGTYGMEGISLRLYSVLVNTSCQHKHDEGGLP